VTSAEGVICSKVKGDGEDDDDGDDGDSVGRGSLVLREMFSLPLKPSISSPTLSMFLPFTPHLLPFTSLFLSSSISLSLSFPSLLSLSHSHSHSLSSVSLSPAPLTLCPPSLTFSLSLSIPLSLHHLFSPPCRAVLLAPPALGLGSSSLPPYHLSLSLFLSPSLSFSLSY